MVVAFTPWRERTDAPAGPFDGVPDHLDRPLREWMHEVLDDDAAIRIALAMRVVLPNKRTPPAALMAEVEADEDLTLHVLDLMLKDRAERPWEYHLDFTDEDIDHLEDLLSRGGSLWTVSPERNGLIRRVTPELKGIFDKTSASGSPAADYLRAAWTSVYGLNPNPNHAFAEAIRAVEDASGKVVTPNAQRFQLNRVATSLRDQRSKFEVALETEVGAEPNPLEVVVTMMEWMIRAHTARHGKPGDEPLQHEKSEAEMAVQLAIPLVEWSEGGYVRRVEESG